MSRLGRTIEPLYRAIKHDIFKFIELLNFKPTPQQVELFKEVQKGSKRIAVKSGQGTGKSASSGVVGLWRLLRSPDSLLVTTAPTMRQCKDVWLAELRRTLEKADPAIQKLVEITASQVRVIGRPSWRCELVTATKPENAQGKHNPNMTIIVEEASGVQRSIIEQYEGTLTNEDAMMLMIGNPNTRDCGFFDCFNSQRHMWATFTFNSEKSPLVSKENIAYMAQKYGVDSDVYRVRILGEFPHSDPNCILSAEDLEACQNTDMLELAQASKFRGFGLDFARYGSDESALFQRTGEAVTDWRFFQKTEPDSVVDVAFKWQLETHWNNNECWYIPDSVGLGGGVMHKFYNAGKQVFEFGSHRKAYDRQYEDMATEAWFGLAAKVKARRWHLPRDNRLIQQLSNRQYYVLANGKVCVESKDEYKKRMANVVEEGGSPDRADAMVMCAYDQVTAHSQIGFGDRVSNKKMGLKR